jgi:hypothetical protein
VVSGRNSLKRRMSLWPESTSNLHDWRRVFRVPGDQFFPVCLDDAPSIEAPIPDPWARSGAPVSWVDQIGAKNAIRRACSREHEKTNGGNHGCARTTRKRSRGTAYRGADQIRNRKIQSEGEVLSRGITYREWSKIPVSSLEFS